MTRHMLRLPRAIESSDQSPGVAAALAERTVPLDNAGEHTLPLIALAGPVRSALLRARRTGRLLRGFDNVAELLAQEHAGLSKLRHAADQHHGERVSRVMLLSRDGSARFFKEAAALAARHRPRLLSCVVDADSGELGMLLFGRDSMTKCILLKHKDAVADFLLSLPRQAHSAPQ